MRGSNTNGQSGYIDQAEFFIPNQIPERCFAIVFKHESGLCE